MFIHQKVFCTSGIMLLACFILLVGPESRQASGVADFFSRPIKTMYKKVSNFGARSSPIRSDGPKNQRYVRPNSLGPSNWSFNKVGRGVDTPSDDYNAKCLLQRGPSLKKNPILFYYSSEKHGPETFGCKVHTRIDLETINSDQDADPELAFDDQAIRAQLLQSGIYNGSRPTYFMIHGFLSSWNGDNWMCKIKDMILNNSEANVFIVDWSGGSKPVLPLDYAAAVGNTKYVGQLLAAFIGQLTSLTGQPDARHFHLIGHSLGAHISGFVGYSVPLLGRITGLDPAGPCFSTSSQSAEHRASTNGFLPDDNKRRLSPQSAQLVVALHTDTSLFGLNENCADYDVYVNGGYKQPKCGSVSLKSRFIDLLNLNLEDSLNPDIACAHSFSHKLVDSFASLFSLADDASIMRHNQQQELAAPRQKGELSPNRAQAETQRCYPMAYECDDWATFKAGECGFCLDRDTRCVFTGLSYENFQLKKMSNPPVDLAAIERLRSISEDDDKFNDEDEDLADDASSDDDDKLKPSDSSSRGQHFMKANGGAPSCLYHYQIIVAARRSSIAQMSNARKYFYYLHIPLEPYGQLNGPDGERLHDRLVQVSHKIEPGSRAHKFLSNQYASAIRQRNSKIYLQTEDLEFYTALITFKQAPEDQCQADETDGSSKSDKWQLCRPLDSIREARLWSSSDKKLDAIKWVAMNYMSGLTYEQRIGNSYIFGRDRSDQVLSREEIDRTDQASIHDLGPTRPGSTGNVFKGVSRQLDCFLSHLDDSADGQAKTNFKCGRSSRELKFALNLRPINLQ